MDHLLYKSHTVDIGTNAEYSQTIVFDYNVSLIRGTFIDSPEYSGDSFSVDIAANKTVGLTTIHASVGQKILYVDYTTIKNAHIGFNVQITDGVNTSDLGICKSKTDSFITFENDISHEFNPGSYVKITVPMVDHYHRNSSFSI